MKDTQLRRRLREAGVPSDSFTFITNTEVEVAVMEDHDEIVDEARTKEVVNLIVQTLGWGGFRCGWGGWVLRADYRPTQGDWNDPESEHHY